MWDTCKKDPGIEITEHATVAKQTIASIGTVIGLPTARNCNRSFEIKIEVNRGSVHIGWINEAVFRSFPKKSIPKGIGCCLGSYAMDSLEGSLGENNKWRPYYKKKLKANDFVTTTLDPINGTIEYWVNGVSLGIAFKGLDVSQKYFPAVSLRYKKTKISCNFRGPFKFEGVGSLGISAFSSNEVANFEKNSEINYEYNNENAPILKLVNVFELIIKIFSYLPEKNLSRAMRASRLLYCAGKDDSLWKEKVAQSFYIKLDHIPSSNYGEIVSQCKSEGVKEISLTSSLMMKEHKKKSDWDNGRYSPKIKNFYFPSFPSTVRFDSEICLISYDNIMKFYDTQTLEEIGGDLKTIENYANINCQQFDENKLVFGDSDGYFSIYNLNNGKRIWRTLSHQGGLESIEFNSENMLLCSGWTRHVSWWDLEVETKTLDIPNCHTEALCVTKYVKGQEDLIITSSYDKTIKLFDLRSSECTATIDFSKSGIPACLDFSIDGNSFAAGSSNGGISIFDMREIGDCYSNILLNINSHRSTVSSLFYDGYRLISGGYDQKVIGWDTELNERNFTIKPGNKVICMYFDGTRLGVGLDSKKLGWYDLSQSPVKQYTSMREVYAKRI